ncbi:hypothetical protein CALVIDRAFT_600459 [Calocera viscosa TUFC12733]|uniref:Uncharacterized protein n=1 Tax=Calocera viscosa (strain TUFC12733) TaxID=1330018 RepID=A0A167JMY9_CALVF|nr:hypothetical protein CALVIDRAFT_600459 [Calocera viscosa TUFC12733]
MYVPTRPDSDPRASARPSVEGNGGQTQKIQDTDGSPSACGAIRSREMVCSAEGRAISEVHVGRPQRFDMYWDTLEGLERGALKEQLAVFERDVAVKERIAALRDPDGTVDIPEESAQELLEMIRDIPGLAEEQAYLEDLLAD